MKQQSNGPNQENTPQLKQSLSLATLTFYGLGTIIGAGIYALIGKVAAFAGASAAYAFLLSGIIAGFTAFSYAELSARFPKSAGEALYVHKAWNRKWIAQLIGWLVVLTGIVSSATITNGFVGYLQVFIDASPTVIMLALIFILAAVACWGIKESTTLITIITLLEIGGLIFVISIAGQGDAATTWSEMLLPTLDSPHVIGILTGGFIAFYAFIGFEDMVNVAEEVKNPQKTLPLSILLAVTLSTILYIVVAVMALRSMSATHLAESSAPLADIVANRGYSATWISLISLVALVNGALAQIIMASRVLYGMGSQQMAPKFLAIIHPKTHTPIIGTVLIAVCILVFALWLPLTTLAQTTSFIMLTIFSLVNLSLVVIKYRSPTAEGVRTYPMWLPVVATILCVLLLGWQAFYF